MSLLLACGGASDAPTSVPFADLPECELLPAGDELDLENRCAAGVCVGMSYADMAAVLGDVACDSSFGDNVKCQWEAGVYAYFDDVDDDSAPDRGDFSSILYVSDGFEGASPDGLGVGISLGCWLDVFGYLEDLTLTWDDEAYVLYELDYDDEGITVRDNGALDGRSETIALFD